MAIPTFIDWSIETIEENDLLITCLFYLHTINGQALQVIQATPISNNSFTYEISTNFIRAIGSRFIQPHLQHWSSHFDATNWLTSFISNYPPPELLSSKFSHLIFTYYTFYTLFTKIQLIYFPLTTYKLCIYQNLSFITKLIPR